MDFIDFLVPFIIGSIIGGSAIHQCPNLLKKKITSEKIETHIPLKNLLEIENGIKELEIDEYSKERILKCIDFEMYMIKTRLYTALGKEEYEKRMNEEKK